MDSNEKQADLAYEKFKELERLLPLHRQIERTDGRYFSDRRYQVDQVDQVDKGKLPPMNAEAA